MQAKSIQINLIKIGFDCTLRKTFLLHAVWVWLVGRYVIESITVRKRMSKIELNTCINNDTWGFLRNCVS